MNRALNPPLNFLCSRMFYFSSLQNMNHMRTIGQQNREQEEVKMIARLKAARRSADLRAAEDILGVVALFALLFVALALPVAG